MQPTDDDRLQHMGDAAREAIAFIEGVPFTQFAADRKLLLAVAMDVGIVGEAASRVSQERRSRLPDFPWPQMVAMRNRLIHGYFDVDATILWTTVTTFLPPLVEALDRTLGGDAP